MNIPTNPEAAPAIRECFCVECGLVASAWFHSDFILAHDGFRCIWCCFPDGIPERPDMGIPAQTWEEAGRLKPDGPFVPLPRW